MVSLTVDFNLKAGHGGGRADAAACYSSTHREDIVDCVEEAV